MILRFLWAISYPVRKYVQRKLELISCKERIKYPIFIISGYFVISCWVFNSKKYFPHYFLLVLYKD